MKSLVDNREEADIAMLPLGENFEYNGPLLLDLWYPENKNITIEVLHNVDIPELEITTHNFNNIIFSPKYKIKIDHLKIHCPGLKLDTPENIEIGTCSIYTTRPEVTFTDLTTNKLNIEYVINEDMERVRELLTGVAVIPGGGEFVLDPNHSYKQKAFSSLNELKETFPNIKWIAPIVSWFASSLEIKECVIKPGADKYYKYPAPWQVSSYSSSTLEKNPPHFIKTKEESSIYGGTINDQSLVEYLEYAKKLGLQVMLNPLIMVNQDDKPWRGWIGKGSNANDVEEFYENQYKPFILHYANLVKGKVDAFIIGSELVGLTSLKTNKEDFTFVEKLINLAKLVKEILGPHVKITYAANWTEYHTVDGILRPLDKLWASPDIDVVGIDAYFPISHSKESGQELEELKKGWVSGEGIDFYLKAEEKIEFKKNEPWNQWKNLDYWYNNQHWVGNEPTQWQSKMKPLCFTEFGFSSIDKSPNQPNVFYNPECKDSNIPPFSNGKVDYAIQLRALRATLEQWQNSGVVNNLFCWAWDARGLDWQEDQYFTDGNLWKYGHWIDGKIKAPEHKIVLKGKITLKGEEIALIINAKIVEISGEISANSLDLKNDNIVLKDTKLLITKTFELKAKECSVSDATVISPRVALNIENNFELYKSKFKTTDIAFASKNDLSINDITSESLYIKIDSRLFNKLCQSHFLPF